MALAVIMIYINVTSFVLISSLDEVLCCQKKEICFSNINTKSHALSMKVMKVPPHIPFLHKKIWEWGILCLRK